MNNNEWFYKWRNNMGMPYKFDNTRTDVQKQMDLIKKDLEDRLKASEVRFQEELKKEIATREEKLKEVESKKEELKKEVIVKEEKIKEKTEELKKESSAKDSIQKMLDDIKGKQKESIIDCPTCGEGHVHKLQSVEKSGGIGSVGGVYKCTGPHCDETYMLVDPKSDYKCATCGMPHKRPIKEELSKKVACPFCDGTKMNKYDWGAKFENLKKVR